jgi:hypothetical protein
VGGDDDVPVSSPSRMDSATNPHTHLVMTVAREHRKW